MLARNEPITFPLTEPATHEELARRETHSPKPHQSHAVHSHRVRKPRVKVVLTSPNTTPNRESIPKPSDLRLGAPDGTNMGEAAHRRQVTAVNLVENQNVSLIGESGMKIGFVATHVVNYSKLSRATQEQLKSNLSSGDVMIQVGQRVFILNDPSGGLIADLQVGFKDFHILFDHR
ncbi:MAG: hypothetical protein COV45_00860 [Deltaproteobacteria bacterium CG11_big_fil_rev_8_21_14_0_20_47_16]|nr:MAG: hypothetical protein COV45_00860 [Deltaproteobacteria bacterium CG11_big_fil_rev_8_21_14_0_20_47_16]